MYIYSPHLRFVIFRICCRFDSRICLHVVFFAIVSCSRGSKLKRLLFALVVLVWSPDSHHLGATLVLPSVVTGAPSSFLCSLPLISF